MRADGTDAPFPNGLVGQSSDRLRLRFGDRSLLMETPDPALRLTIPPEYEEFIDTGGQEPDCRFVWRMGPVECPSSPPTVESLIWRAWIHDDGSDETIFFWGGEIPYLSVRFDRDYRHADVTRIARNADPRALNVAEYPFSEYVASRLLARRGAVELHASAVLLDDRVYVFVGHSGAGKTTISLLAEENGAQVLSDDRTIISIGADGPTAWGTPWHGTGQRTSSRFGPVDGVFLLAQDSVNRTSPMAPGMALKELFVRTIQPMVQESEVHACLKTLENLVTEFPVRWLHFTRSADAIAVAVASGYSQTSDGLTSCNPAPE